jgi:putative ABC transport system permease protein
VIQEISALPAGTSAPNTVLTEHAVRSLHLPVTTDGWLITTPQPPTAAQISAARAAAAAAGMKLETRNSVPSSATITNWTAGFGIVLGLGILAMAIGLLRSETAGSVQTLTATGAGGLTRRTLTAVTAGTLALLAALLGTAAAYLGAVAFSWGNPLDGLSELAGVPVWDLLFIVIGMPLLAALAGWLLAGREPAVIARRPLE